MNFFEFLFFDLILFAIKIFILLFLYKFFVKKKCNIFSDIAENEIENYFNAYDNNFSDSTDSDDFDKTIHVIDK